MMVLSEGVFINVALSGNTRVIGDGPRYFKPCVTGARVNGKCAQFCVRVKNRTEVRERGTPRDLRHIHEKVGRLPRSICIREGLTTQQQTLLWNEEKYLRLAPGEQNEPRSLMFDKHTEELSFPAIYFNVNFASEEANGH
ncbi:hypothetical protein TNCV_4101381 [Trichonephila clavipes]|nr:hypothetical protein TNCV_4101381 [Trichonephila clavipes]